MSVITFAAFFMMLAAALAILTDWLFKTLDPWAAEVQQTNLAHRKVTARRPVLQRSLPRFAAKPAISYQNEIRELPFFC